MKVSIVGAGFSGLSLAYFLIKNGFEVEILEKSSRPGGLINTLSMERGLVETGATSILLTKDLEEILKDLGLDHLSPQKESRKKYISIEHSPSRMPIKLRDLFFLIKGIFNIKFRKKSSAPRKGETLSSWSERIFNRSINKKLISPGMLGIYADYSKSLSASLVMRKLFTKAAKNKSKGPVNFKGGMRDFINSLESFLVKKGVIIKYDSEVESLDQLEKPYVIAGSFHQAKKLITTLPALPLKNMTSATLFFDGTPPLKGFGTLFPEEENLSSQGVLFNTSMFEKRTKKGFSETWILSEKTNLSSDELTGLILKDREKVFKSDKKPIEAIVHHWEDAFPLYGTELESALSLGIKLPEATYITGNFLGNLGLSGIIEQNKLLSQKMASDLL